MKHSNLPGSVNIYKFHRSRIHGSAALLHQIVQVFLTKWLVSVFSVVKVALNPPQCVHVRTCTLWYRSCWGHVCGNIVQVFLWAFLTEVVDWCLRAAVARRRAVNFRSALPAVLYFHTHTHTYVNVGKIFSFPSFYSVTKATWYTDPHVHKQTNKSLTLSIQHGLGYVHCHNVKHLGEAVRLFVFHQAEVREFFWVRPRRYQTSLVTIMRQPLESILCGLAMLALLQDHHCKWPQSDSPHLEQVMVDEWVKHTTVTW